MKRIRNFKKNTFRSAGVMLGLSLILNLVFSPAVMAYWVQTMVWVPGHFETQPVWVDGYWDDMLEEMVEGHEEDQEVWVEGGLEPRYEWVEDDDGDGDGDGNDVSTTEPINTTSGSNYFTEERLSVPATGIPLEMNLKYQSITNTPSGDLGTGWRHSYEWSLISDTNHATLYTGTGSRQVFEVLTNGVYQSPDGSQWKLSASGSEHELWMPGGKTYHFDSAGKLSTIQDAWGNGIECTYTINDCLEAVTHANGRQMVFSNQWDSAVGDWRAVSISVGNGASLAFSYNADGQFTQVVEQVGINSYTSTYQYADGFLTNKINGAGYEYTFDYETGTDGHLNGKGTYLAVDGYYEHDVEYTDTDTTDVTYHQRGLEQVYRYSRNEGRLVTQYGPGETITQAQQRGINYGYATNNIDKTEETLFDNSTGATWSQWMLYDDAHNMTNLAASYGSTNSVQMLSMQYDPDWQQLSAMIDAEGARTEIVYTNGSLLAYKAFYSDTQSHDTCFAYTTNGLLKTITNANGHVTQLDYNAAGDLLSAFAEAGPVISNSYNSLGVVSQREILSETGASTGRITQMDRDEKGRVTQVVYPDELTASYQYNALGDLTDVVDRAGRVTELAYAPTRKLTSVTRYLNQSGSNVPVRISYNYDEQFNTLSITEPRNRYVESYQLDIQDRVTSVTNIEGQVMSLDYSIGSFVTNITRFDQSHLDIVYDSAGRQSSIAYIPAGGSAASLTVSRDYYADGQLKTIADSTSSVSNNYDRLNRRTNVVTTIGSFQSSIANAYDPVGNLTNSVVDIGESNSIATAYFYDAAERLSRISTTDGQSFQYGYSSANGRISSITNLESGLVISYAYDLMDRATNISYRTSTGTLIRLLDYQYDAVGMIQNVVSDNGSEVTVKNYQYDSMDRLVSETQTAGGINTVSSYSYDLAGNRLSKISNGWKTETTLGTGNRLVSVITSAVTNTLFISGSANEPIGTDERWGTLLITNLTSGTSVVPSVNGSSFSAEVPSIGNATNIIVAAIGDRAGNVGYATNSVWVSSATGGANETQSFEYDTAGSLTNLNGMALNWDERYRLTSVTSATSSVNYSYDVLGRRVSCSVGSASQTNTEYYVYNGNQVAADLDGSGKLRRTYVWGPGIDNLLSLSVYTNGGAQASATYYPIKDHQNSILVLVDSNGTVVESYEYDAWGNAKVFDANGDELTESAIGNRNTFQGREIDWETGLYYFRARWYNPVTGRWLTKDPIGISGGLNLYVFCGNNPVNFIDPFGLCEKDWKKELWEEMKWQMLMKSSKAAYQLGKNHINSINKAGEALTKLPGVVYGAYQTVRDTTPPGTPATGGAYPAIDKGVDLFNLGTSAIESMLDD